MRQRTTPTVRDAFARHVAEAPDLADLSPTAQRLLIAAAALFHDRGAADTSVRDITGACGLSPGAFYRHFRSRDELLHRLVAHGHDSLDRRVDEAIACTDGTPVGRTAGFVHGYVTGHLLWPEVARVVRREYVHLGPERFEQVVGRRRALRTRLEELLDAGARDGTMRLIDGPHAPTRTAVMILDMCSRTSEWYDPTRSRAEPPESLADRYVSAALRLVGVEGPDDRRGGPAAR